MVKIKLTQFLLMLISPITLSAQSINLNNNEIAEHISNLLINSHHPDSIMLSKTCRRGCLFIKFKINDHGKISDLAF